MKKFNYLRNDGKTKIFGLKKHLFDRQMNRQEIRIDAYEDGVAIIKAKSNSLGEVKEWANIALECLSDNTDFNEVLNKAYNRQNMKLKEIIIDYGNDILVSVYANNPKTPEEIFNEYWNLLLMLVESEDDD